MTPVSGLFLKADKFAGEVRQQFELGLNPVDIFGLLEALGIFLVKIPIQNGILSGSFLYDGDRDEAWVMINSAHTMGRQRFTASHELCHFLKDRDKTFITCEVRESSEKPDYEKFADQFAASFLLPKEALDKRLQDKSTVSAREAVKICVEFGVSYQSTLWRLFFLDFISSAQRDLLEDFSPTNVAREIGVKRDDPLNPFVLPPQEESLSDTLPKKYRDLALDLFKAGLMSKAKLAEYLDGFTSGHEESSQIRNG